LLNVLSGLDDLSDGESIMGMSDTRRTALGPRRWASSSSPTT
jgi:hypothetical protein